jgi:hypothetical protein
MHFYIISIQDLEVKQHEIPLQYHAYKDVFGKKNVDMLIEHQ